MRIASLALLFVTSLFTTPAAASPLTPSVPSAFFELPVPGYDSALVSVPRDTSRPRPVLVVAHGARVDPEWQCSVWQEALGDRAFILCPRGERTTRDGNVVYVWGSNFGAVMDASITALRARFGPRVDPGPMVFNGYSQGAYLAPQYVMKNVARFPRVVMTEGGQRGWNPQAFAKAGGTRMLFACGQTDCEKAARPVTTTFARAGVESRLAYAQGGGHSYGGAVGERIREQLPWLFAGDPRW